MTQPADDVTVIDGPMPDGSLTAWRYPELYRLRPGQSLLYRWERFDYDLASKPTTLIRHATHWLRRTRGWDISHCKADEGVWVERRS